MLLLLLLIVVLVPYSLLIWQYYSAWQRIPVPDRKEATSVRFSVVIAARNEAAVLAELLTALQLQDFPADSFEVILVDDHSTDDTAAIARGFRVQVLQLEGDITNSFKKKAIETGIAAAKYEWIVTTDADCVPGSSWLSELASFISINDPVMVAAPVRIPWTHSLPGRFQTADFLVLQGITGATVFAHTSSMCNGANLAYRRDVFYECGGFAGIDHIASGDDMLLMYKVSSKYPGSIGYLKSTGAIVDTAALKDWKAFFQQRIRWASKATHYQDKRLLPVMILVYLLNLSILFALLMGMFDSSYLLIGAAGLMVKAIVELPFYTSVASFFGLQHTVGWFLLLQPLHVVYIVISGLFGQFGKYQWKGRIVK